MRTNKVEICGIDTAQLRTFSEEEKRELLRRVRTGDTAARDALVMGNLRLVLSVIGRFNPKGDSADDLFQVGCIGLIKAIDHFNTELGVKFSTYAVPMIIGEVRRYLRDNNAIRVSRSLRDLAYRALQAREALTRQSGKEPSLCDLAEAIGEPQKSVAAAMDAIAQPVSLYDSVYNDGEDSVYVIDQLRDVGDTDENWIESITLREAMKTLGEREQRIIKLRFYRGKTQMEIAEEIGISQAQVSRLEKGAIERIKKFF